MSSSKFRLYFWAILIMKLTATWIGTRYAMYKATLSWAGKKGPHLE